MKEFHCMGWNNIEIKGWNRGIPLYTEIEGWNRVVQLK